MTCPFLFVYGTLKSDARNENAKFLHQHAQYLGNAKWQGALYLVSNYPGAIPSSDASEWVYGELWQMHDPQMLLMKLDEYEECSASSPVPHEYTRSLEKIILDGKTQTAWVYLFNLDISLLSKIESGVFENNNQILRRRSG